ncbi:hypothetical protein ACERK3_14570 [Phycisphaerales bacterium AB-hyl4]|uniref:LacI family transcriptional regulator n=1 Tax=Natronomicrosphaera hydrolytica TaxID=3242702 RepID=A0ABV4U7E3_9BACT
MQSAEFDFKQEVDLLRNLDSSFVAGAIIYPPPLPEIVEQLRELRRRGVSYVLVDTLPASLDVDAVVSDRVKLGRVALTHILEQGHRRIGMIDHTGKSVTACEVREGAFGDRRAGACRCRAVMVNQRLEGGRRPREVPGTADERATAC